MCKVEFLATFDDYGNNIVNCNYSAQDNHEIKFLYCPMPTSYFKFVQQRLFEEVTALF